MEEVEDRAAHTLRLVRERVARVFRYLQALNQHRSPATRLVHEQPWHLWLRDLPNHSCVTLSQPEGAGDTDAILRVRRPDLTPAPRPPSTIEAWIDEWQDPTHRYVVRDAAKIPPALEDVLLRASPERVAALTAWEKAWLDWAVAERPVRAAMRMFEDLYALHGRLEREGERLELVLGDGLLSWRRDDGGVYHPVLLQRVQLSFDPAVPEFVITDVGRESELYTALFSSMPEIDPRALARCRAELEQGGYAPRGLDGTAGFLRSLAVQLSARAKFDETAPPRKDADPPEMGRESVLFLRERNLGFALALERILNDISEREDFATALIRIVGVDPVEPVADAEPTALATEEVEDVLLSKPANQEQVQIARRLERHGCVLVQGPPGTGKTHTIANLIGHLLANRKSVLVTSHTSKALRVLRNQVVEPLRPLCVSVLESDLEGRRQLEGAVQAIAERLSSADADHLQNDAKRLAAIRAKLIDELKKYREALLDARASEYRAVVIAGQSWRPSEAARKVAAEVEQNSWIPGEVQPEATVPLSQAELEELYATNLALTPGDEAELASPLPKPSEIMAPAELSRLLNEHQTLTQSIKALRAEFWDKDPSTHEPNLIAEIERALDAVSTGLDNTARWKLDVINAGTQGAAHDAWRNLIRRIQDALEAVARARDLVFEHAPIPAPEIPVEEQLQVLGEIIPHVEAGGGLGSLKLLARPSWKRLVQGARVASGAPAAVAHFRAIAAELEVRRARNTLVGRWERQMVPLGAPGVDQLGAAPEQTCMQFVGEIEKCLGWSEQMWKPLQARLEAIALGWERIVDAQPAVVGDHGPILRFVGALRGPVREQLRAAAAAAQLARLKRGHAKAVESLSRWGGASSPSALVRALTESLGHGDAERYAAAHARLVDLTEKQRSFARRFELLKRVEAVAPTWAIQLRLRQGIHGASRPPGAAESAWVWRQLHDELERRGRVQIEDLQSAIEKHSEELRRVTAELIEKQAWVGQVRRTTRAQQQALVGWLDLVKKIGKGTGKKRTPRLRAEASRKMNECKDAVPVWIMPLTHVAENFHAISRFDVVIIDEASQSDVMALLALYMGKQVVVVGDHEQVSPSAVGQNLTIVQHLIDIHLPGIPNSLLYDGQTSVYDLARQSFGGIVCLTEHFRCVPDIIEFSNHLSYDGRIKPLRAAATSKLHPHVVTYRVNGRAQNKVNLGEADCIASLVAAAIQQPEYAGKSIGVVTLVGDEQALEIERRLRERIAPSEYERRHILCGNAAHFQGDERDVMFISMVDGPEDGPLAMRTQPMFKQRFNVAASRARDQMWVIHSVDPATDLKPGDLRRLLLEHCVNPFGKRTAMDKVAAAAESQFERAVAERLVRRGYRVVQQWQVGHYRIDMVVEGAGKRLAIECDGDKYHPLEKLPDDLARQAILERLGWRFVRVRGSAFFRSPDEAMAPVFQKLEQLGISPEGGGAPPAQTADDELCDRVVRLAETLRLHWREADRADATPAAAGSSGILVGPADVASAPRTPPSPAQSVVPERSEPPSAHRPPRQLELTDTRPAERASDREPASEPPPRRDVGASGSLRPAATTLRASAAGCKPFKQTLLSRLSAEHRRCPKCGAERELVLGRNAPQLRCKTASCATPAPVPAGVLREAVASSRLSCPRCGSPASLASPDNAPFVGCSRYPQCSGSVAWADIKS